MNSTKKLCTNFQRGSCQYGARCRFLHSTQQQSKPNVYGFGTQNGSNAQQNNVQQQKPNPFGFGTQKGSSAQQTSNPFGFGAQNRNNSTSTGTADPRQNQFKPFENKWNRNASTATSPRQPDNQSQAASSHKCTDPESCKREIVEDFQNEKPLWRLTCYGHRKNGPCDISGDISYEELRAAAYSAVKSGLSLQSIVERERSLLNAKLVEFENLLHQPYAVPPNSTLSSGSSTPFPPSAAASFNPQNNSTFSAPGFNQPGQSSSNLGFGPSSSTPISNAFQQSNAFQISNQTSSGFGTNNMTFGKTVSLQIPVSTSNQPQNGFGRASIGSFVSSAPINNAFQQPNAFQSSSQTLSGFGTNSLAFGKTEPHTPVLPNNGPPLLQNGFGQATSVGNLANNTQMKDVPGDAKIWLKEKWSRGEIPEVAPPDAYI